MIHAKKFNSYIRGVFCRKGFEDTPERHHYTLQIVEFKDTHILDSLGFADNILKSETQLLKRIILTGF